MFDPDKYLADLILNCRSAFGERLLYMGLQGSWLRGEAHENSDIDVMMILDRFSVRDMRNIRYHDLRHPNVKLSTKNIFCDFLPKFHLDTLVRVHENSVDQLLAHFDGQTVGGVDFLC